MPSGKVLSTKPEWRVEVDEVLKNQFTYHFQDPYLGAMAHNLLKTTTCE